MNKRRNYFKGLFLISAIYDFVLGIAFLFFYKQIFNLLGMNLPENPAYLTFSAIMITLLGILLFMIYLKLEGSRRLILYAIFIKFAYIGTVLYYYLFVGTDYVDAPFLIFAGLDFIFALLFIESLREIRT